MGSVHLGVMEAVQERAPVTTNNILFPLELDYMPLDCEVKVLSKRCGIRQEDAEKDGPRWRRWS